MNSTKAVDMLTATKAADISRYRYQIRTEAEGWLQGFITMTTFTVSCFFHPPLQCFNLQLLLHLAPLSNRGLRTLPTVPRLIVGTAACYCAVPSQLHSSLLVVLRAAGVAAKLPLGFSRTRERIHARRDERQKVG